MEQLADKLNISKYYFIVMFKRITDRTPLDYLNHHRMRQAAKLLETAKFKIIDIVDALLVAQFYVGLSALFPCLTNTFMIGRAS